MKNIKEFIIKIPVFVLLIALGYYADAQRIKHVEYFIDVDPGFGNGVSVPVSPADNINNLNFNINVTSLSLGFHQLYVRAKDSTGLWCHTGIFPFFLERKTEILPRLVKAEYFIDNDPGFDHGTLLTLQHATGFDSIFSTLPIGSLSNGIHTIYTRVKDSSGKWSQTNMLPIYKAGVLNQPAKLISYEYFIDSDPGFGNGSQLSISPHSSVDSLNMIINLIGSSQGLHELYIRAKDSIGNWSLTNHLPFYKEAATDSIYPVTRLEYFIDNDPGFGNGNSLAITSGVNLINIFDSVNVSGLTNGIHTLYIRAGNAGKFWGLTNYYVFYKETSVVGNSNIVRVEYFFGNDPGFGNADGFTVNPQFLNDSISFFIDETCMADGEDAMLYIRTMDVSHRWSHTNIDTLIKKPLQLFQGDSVSACNGDSVKLSATSASGLSYTWLYNGAPVSGIHDSVYYAHNGGSYSVIVSNVSLCSDTSENTEVAIYPIPSMPSVVTPVNYCQGDSPLPLSASGTSLLWYLQPAGGQGTGITPVPSTATPGITNYYVTQTINSCESNRNNINVTVYNIPATPTIILLHDTLFSSAVTGNQWYNSSGIIQGENDYFYVPTANDDYYVIVSQNGCTSEQSNIIHFDNSGVEKYSGLESLSVYPNPFTKEIFISVNADGIYHLTLYDEKGSVLKSVHGLNGRNVYKLEIGDYEQGIYILRVWNENLIGNLKIVKVSN